MYEYLTYTNADIVGGNADHVSACMRHDKKNAREWSYLYLESSLASAENFSWPDGIVCFCKRQVFKKALNSQVGSGPFQLKRFSGRTGPTEMNKQRMGNFRMTLV